MADIALDTVKARTLGWSEPGLDLFQVEALEHELNHGLRDVGAHAVVDAPAGNHVAGYPCGILFFMR